MKNTRTVSKTTLSFALVLLAASLACSTTGVGPAFSTQVAQTVQAELEGSQDGDPVDGDPVATAVAATLIASGGTPPPALTDIPQNGSTPQPGATPTPGDSPAPPVDLPQPEVDFNGDRYTDLFVAVPGLDNGDTVQAGGFYIFYGGPEGILSGDLGFWQAQDILPFAAEGAALGEFNAVGDFDGDGFSDLALGYKYGSSQDSSGLVALLYGNADGITTDRLEIWDQDVHLVEGQGLSPGTLGSVEPGDLFGSSLAPGDFNADGYDDLAVGVPGEDLETGSNQGTVIVLYGSPAGLTHVANNLINQNGFFVEQDDQPQRIGDLIAGAEDDDEFGTTLATGDINGDSFDDLVIGVPYEAIGETERAGAVHIIYGSAEGLTPAGNQHPHEDGFYTDTDGDGEVDSNVEGGLFGEPEANGTFGAALAVADFNGDGFGDLAVGAPGHSADTIEVSGIEAAGLVHVIFGSAEGLTSENSYAWNQSFAFRIDGANKVGLLAGGEPEEIDLFGASLQAADYNQDGYADLAVGSTGESRLENDASGAVSVLYGSQEGLTTEASQWFSLYDSVDGFGVPGPGLVGGLQTEVHFGFALTSGDYNADGLPDLVIGAPNFQVNDAQQAGAVYIVFSRPGFGLGLENHQQWTTAGAVDAAGELIANLDGPQQDFAMFGGGLR
jgi:hypothetical protein